jgi:hypothetical protein
MTDDQLLRQAAKIALGVDEREELSETWKSELARLVYPNSKNMLRMFQRVMAGTQALPPNFLEVLESRLLEEGEALLSAGERVKALRDRL